MHSTNSETNMPKLPKKNERNALAFSQVSNGLQIKGRVWIEREGKTYLSWGRVVLLERIEEYGSVSAAAKSMQMSFSHAWHLIEDMNALAPEPLVEKQVGGRRGGGAWLTDAGKRAIEDFAQLVRRFQGWIEQERIE